MAFTKITSEDLADKGVVGLPDTPNLSVTALQKKFDEIATDVIVPKFNNLVDELDEFEVDINIGDKVESNDITNIKLDIDRNLLVSRDNGETYEGTASSGHIIMDGAGRSYDQRARLQFSANTVITDDPSGNATFVQVPSGIKGDKGDAATITVGNVSDGETAEVTNVGSSSDAIFDFVIPKGNDGSAATIQVGTVISGENVSVSNRGTSSQAIFDFVLPKGDKGDAGTSFKVLGMYPTYSDLIEAHPTGNRGDAYAVGTSDENVIYNWDNDTKVWDNLGGLKGVKGDDGKAATVTIGTVITLDSSNNATVENVGTTENAIFNFGLPKGSKGDSGIAATIAVGNVSKGDVASVTNSGTSNNAIFDFVLPKGDPGDPGDPATVNGKSGSNIILYGKDIFLNQYEKATEDLSVNSNDSTSSAIGKLEYRIENVPIPTSGGSNIRVTFPDDHEGETATLTTTKDSYFAKITDNVATFDGILEIGSMTVSAGEATVTFNVEYYSWYEFDVSTIGYKQWLASADIPDTFGSLDAVLASEATVRTLMIKHASVDYLTEWYAENNSIVDTFVANENAMKWIGLKDYACDKLMPIWKTKLLASEYWEYILKDHVPVMTSNVLPCGTVSAGGSQSTMPPYYAFDGNDSTDANICASSTQSGTKYIQYKFVNPVCVKKVHMSNDRNKTTSTFTFTIKGSVDGSQWDELGSISFTSGNDDKTIELDNDKAYFYYRAETTDILWVSGSFSYLIKTLQFYGRALNVSVPTMTSNTTPYGVASAGSTANSFYEPFKAFNGVVGTGNDGNRWVSAPGSKGVSTYLKYAFSSPVLIKKMKVQIVANGSGENPLQATVHFEISDDDVNWTDILTKTMSAEESASMQEFDIDNGKTCRYVRYRSESANMRGSGSDYYVQMRYLQFYGVDYSEDKNYIFDHGIEVKPLVKTSNSILATLDTTQYKLLKGEVVDLVTTDTLKCGSGSAKLTNQFENYLDISSINGENQTGFSAITSIDNCSCWLE